MKHWSSLILFTVVLLLATGLRFYKLDAQSFWNDEGNSARLSERSVARIIEGTASDIHPPLYYLFLRGWRELLGESMFALRAMSAFVGVVTVAATMALTQLLARQRWVALVAGGLAALNPALVYYSQETRMYALLALWGVLATCLLLMWYQSQVRIWLVAYVLVCAAGLYTHYFFPALLLVHNMMVVILLSQHRDASRSHVVVTIRSWVFAMMATVLLYVPWLPIFWRQGGGRIETAVSLETFGNESVRWLLFGNTINGGDVPEWVLLALGVYLLLALWQGGRASLMLLLGVVIPIGVMFVLGTVQSQFFKFMLVAIPFLMALLAYGMAPSTSVWRSWRTVFPLVTLLLTIWPILPALDNLYNDPAFARADYRGMAARIAAEAHPNAAVILDAPNQWEVFTYYHQSSAPVYPLPRGHRAERETLYPALAAIAAEHDRIYTIFWGEVQRDPERLVERWLDENAFKATDEWLGDVRFVTYAVPSAPTTEMKTAVHQTFGEHVQLNGYSLSDSNVVAGDILQVTLFWETAEPLSQRFKVFLHLIDVNGQLVAQRDSEPGGGLTLTTIWQPGEEVIDNHGVLVPFATEAGSYQLRLGLYDIADPTARLPIQTEAGVADTLLLATITVE